MKCPKCKKNIDPDGIVSTVRFDVEEKGKKVKKKIQMHNTCYKEVRDEAFKKYI